MAGLGGLKNLPDPDDIVSGASGRSGEKAGRRLRFWAVRGSGDVGGDGDDWES